MRLIDADKLYDDLADKLKWLMGYGDDVYLSVGDDIRCAVANQPTAYDPDKVVEQLEDYGNEEMDYYRDTPYERCIEVCVNKAIEIVRGSEIEIEKENPEGEQEM